MPAVLQNYQPVTADRLKNPEAGNWLMIRRNYQAWSYSPLTQINAENVKRLQLVWVWAMNDGGANETTRPAAENEVDRDDVRASEQFLLRDKFGAYFGCPLGRQILTPGNHVHVECLADPRHGAADIAET